VTYFQTVADAYREAWSRRIAFVLVHVCLRLAAYALIVPALGGLVNWAVSLSDQSALTDQDIAYFLLTPLGFLAAVGVLAVFLVAEVLGFATMAAVLRSDSRSHLQSVRNGLALVMSKGAALLVFALIFVLRVLALTVPFVLAGLFVASRYLTEYDINYYLSARPPEAVMAAVLIGVIAVVLAGLLLSQLSGWALALHLVLFGNVAPQHSFARSAEMMRGDRGRLGRLLVIWLAVRVAVGAAIAACAGAVVTLFPFSSGGELKTVLIVALVVLAVSLFLGAVLAAVALGALAQIIGGFYPDSGTVRVAGAVLPGSLRRQLGILAACLFGLTVLGIGAGAMLIDDVQTIDQVEIIGHRGAAGSRPENTMASVQKAIEDGADWVEIDVQETADGAIAVVHDSDFMKLAGVDRKVWEVTRDELSAIDIGSWFDATYAAERTPLLSDVLAAAKGRSRVLIELKYYGHDVDLESRVAQIVEQAGMTDQVAIMSLKYPAVRKMQQVRPGWRTGVLAATSVGDLAGLEADFVAVSTGAATARLSRATKAAGMDLYVWTVNDPLEMSRMISMGANGLITDEPALARRVLEIRADLNTPQRLLLWASQMLGLSLSDKVYRDDAP
jgi:glycerophosphoryl diester phosphodiesterase